MQHLRRLFRMRPQPFSWLKRKLNIEPEWESLKNHIRPHRGKIVVAVVVGCYPFYRQYLSKKVDEGKKVFSRWLDPQLTRGQPTADILENFSKELVDSILHDRNIKQEAALFVNDLSKREKVLTGVLELLLSVVNTPVFIEEGKALGQKIVIQNANNFEVQQELKAMVLRVLNSVEVQQQAVQVIKVIFSSPTATKTLIKLLITSINDESVKAALNQAIRFSLKQLLNDHETVEQFKQFGHYLLEEFQKDIEKQRLVALLVKKGVGLDRAKQQQSSTVASQPIHLEAEGGPSI